MKTPLHILHIDDNFLDRELVRDALEHESDNFVVTAAASQQEFERQLATNTYDLVLTDFNILGFEGFQVIDLLHQKDPTLPVIVVTGTGSEEIAVEAMKRGAIDYVIKSPKHIRRLPTTIQTAMEVKRLRDERIRAEQARQSSEEQLRAFAHALPDIAFIMDEDGRYIQLLNAPEHLLYALVSNRLGKCVHEVLPSQVADQIMEAIHQTVKTSLTQTIEYQLQLPSGLTWFEGRTSLMAITAGDKKLVVYVARDITARKRAEEALRESIEQLNAVVSGAPVILFAFDKAGILTLLQGRGLEVFGGNPNHYLGLPVVEIAHHFVPDIQEHLRQIYSGDPVNTLHKILIPMKGEVVLDVRYSPLRDMSGEISNVIGVATDVTEQLKAERLQIELEKEQEVIALKERFISTASHDFRTPLTIIKMSVNLLDTYADRITPEQRKAKLRQISVQVDSMNQLLTDVLTMSRANAGKLDFRPERIELKPFCQQIWDNFQFIAEKTHQMEFVYQCDRSVVYFDPNMIHYMLANLLSNALKYSPVNGHIRLEVICNSDTLIFRVSDNGIGIPEQDQAQLFQPFHRATNTAGIDGTGLGLVIVKSYVEAHQGYIEVHSIEGQGTTFEVHIPYL